MSYPGRKATLYCSFCGKSQHEVAKLISGPSAFICNECVGLCEEVLRSEEMRKATPIEMIDRLILIIEELSDSVRESLGDVEIDLNKFKERINRFPDSPITAQTLIVRLLKAVRRTLELPPTTEQGA